MVKRLVVVLAAVVFAAGCANSSSSSGPSSASSAGGSSAGASPAPGAPTSPGASGASTKLSGTIQAGVEPNCLLLTGSGQNHQLIFADPAVKKLAKIGDKVTVVGRARPAQMTTCQQGIPFVVESLSVD